MRGGGFYCVGYMGEYGALSSDACSDEYYWVLNYASNVSNED